MKKLLVFCCIMLAGWSVSLAQNYPVHVNLYLAPPYSPYFSDYYAPGSNNLFANIILTDASEPQVEVVFKVSVIGDKLKLTSKPDLPLTPLTIQGGVPVRIEGSDLASYFQPQNLNVQGEGVSNFSNTGKLPEGYYIFTLEVVEYYRKVVISNQALAFAWVVLNDPPQWITPLNFSKITANEPQNIFFSWMPMHMGSPNSAFNTQYTFKLCEMPSVTSDPNVVISSTNPIYTEDVFASNMLYGPDKPVLEAGKVYVAQVRAFDTDNRDLFKNNGYSKPVVFKFGESCKTPLYVAHNSVTKVTATFNWTPSPGNTSYVVDIRQNQDSVLTNWYSYPTTEVPFKAKQLLPSSRYEYRVKAICGDEWNGISSPYSQIGSFNTMESGNATYNCNDVVELPVINGTSKVNALTVGQQIQVGGFYTRVTQVDKSNNGVFSGFCETVLPIWGLKVYCSFTDISVNINNQVLNGNVKALRMVNQSSGNGTDGSGGTNDNGSDGNGGTGSYGDLDGFKADTVIVINTVVDSVVVDSTGTTIIYTDDGGTTVVTTTGDIQIDDSDNNVYVVKDGKVYKNPPGVNPSNGSQGKPEYSKLIAVNFSHGGAMETHGFDHRDAKVPAFDPQYDKIEVHRNDYFVDWASVPSYQTDLTKATIRLQEGGGSYSDVKFRTLTGPAITSTAGTDSTQYLLLQGGTNNEVKTYEAYYPVTDDNGKNQEVTAGKLNLISYDEVSVNVCLVSVNGIQYPYGLSTLKNNLRKIFNPAIASISVSTLSLTNVDWDIDPHNSTLSNTESGALSNYNNEMKAIKSALRGSDNYDKNTYYLFLVPASDDPSVLGYMPLKGQYGFIMVNAGGNNSEEKLTRTIAHELSHGVFRLRHTFSQYNLYTASQGTTHNLMDYTNNSNDNQLIKYQWDYIHDPENMVGIFQDEGEGEMTLLKANLSLVFYNDSSLVNNQVLYFLPEISKEITLTAKQTKSDVIENVKVNWSYNDQKEVEQISFTPNEVFFSDKEKIEIDVTERVLLGPDSTLTYFIGKVDVSPAVIIDSVLINFKNIKEAFDSLSQELSGLLTENMDDISLLEPPKYYHKGMNKYYAVLPDNPNTDFDKVLVQMYHLDSLMNTLENFEALAVEVTNMYKQESSKKEFFDDVISALKDLNPLERKEELDKQYKEQIITATLKELTDRLNKN